MRTLFGTARLRVSVALASALLASSFAEPLLIAARAAQKPAASFKSKGSLSEEITRPRTVSAATPLGRNRLSRSCELP